MKSPALVAALGTLAALGSGCGRTSLLREGGVDTCPPGQVIVDGQCVTPVDMAHGDGFVPPGDSFVPPGADLAHTDDGFVPPPYDMANCHSQPEICGNGVDDNCNGLTDCQDPACFFDPSCQPNPDFPLPPDMATADMSGGCQAQLENCTNGVDDNCDGLVDCQDPECAGAPNCGPPGREICNNGIDDDHNGLTDCQDPACANFPGCQPHMCDPNHVDCTDPACAKNPKCQDLRCMPTVDFGTLQQHDSTSEKMVSTVGTMDVAITPCGPGGGGMVVTKFTVASDNTAVKLSFTQSMGADHVFGLFRAGVLQGCAANPVGCYSPNPPGAPMGSTTWVLDAGEYYLIVQAFTAQHQGTADVTLSTPSSKLKEICNNGIDDDGNGLIDCQDPACFNDPSCKKSECKPDINVGTLVLGDPPKMASFTTVGAGSKYEVQCAEGKGQDMAVEFSLAETVGVLMQWDQAGDHVVGLFQLPGPGKNCDAIPLGCYDPSGRKQDLVAWGELPPGSYLLVFQAVRPGSEGHVDVQLSAYKNRKQELCHNGIDDDGNGLIDCADPACFSDPGCGAPVCMPDVNLGTLHLGQQASTQVNTQQGILNEQLTCAKGGGKAKIVEVTLAENAGMGFQCTDTGQNVLGLFAQAGPRDSCDKTEVDCADPGVIPFGCDYEIPNLQPGTYYVIVEAFKAGTEGVVDLTISSIKDRALEICNNGIDDDKDGFTDCADRKCATSPYCINKQCKADASIDPMPISANPLMPVYKLVQTAGQQVSAQPPCEAQPGGGDAVVYINLPGQANLRVDYAQVGSHVFALYPDIGNGLICEAAPAQACTPSNGAQAGTVTYAALPPGEYWFIVAADKPGDEGSASLKFTATP